MAFGATKPRLVRGELPPLESETEYTLRIDFDIEGSPEALDRVLEKAREVCPNSVGYSDSTGGPAWQAYIEFRGFDKAETEGAARKVANYIKRFKGHVFYVWDD